MNLNQIILASSSPRRIAMMRQNGIEPIIVPADVDETIPEGLSMEEAVMYLALKKALFVEEKCFGSSIENKISGTAVVNGTLLENPLIIAADTVVFRNSIIGKPKDREDAFNILLDLKGKSHDVATGVAIIRAGMPVRKVFYEVTKVYVKDFSLEELNAYLDTDEPYDKAGAYAIQGVFNQHIDRIEGDLNNVIGFPWDRIQRELVNLK
ncbi:Maf family protein [Clostridium aminobutyricum]|uniref:dTTP/UTP pyrophosphatase n=1 Tax=Clostridium aminobutyricum TaxID=33953 RepID=A0A939D7Q6_CLOAM|nr:Maf family protein [Clostridium aminobutyricum]MBN7772757.1 septum formation protein Maf [Clostridium aminobutyricum]